MNTHNHNLKSKEMQERENIPTTIPVAETDSPEQNVIFYHEHPSVTKALQFSKPDVQDIRLYVPWPERVTVQLKKDVSNEFCYKKFPGQEYYHNLLTGELYVEYNDNKYCLSCALQQGLVTLNRMFWQHKSSFEQLPQSDPE